MRSLTFFERVLKYWPLALFIVPAGLCLEFPSALTCRSGIFVVFYKDTLRYIDHRRMWPFVCCFVGLGLLISHAGCACDIALCEVAGLGAIFKQFGRVFFGSLCTGHAGPVHWLCCGS